MSLGAMNRRRRCTTRRKVPWRAGMRSSEKVGRRGQQSERQQHNGTTPKEDRKERKDGREESEYGEDGWCELGWILVREVGRWLVRRSNKRLCYHGRESPVTCAKKASMTTEMIKTKPSPEQPSTQTSHQPQSCLWSEDIGPTSHTKSLDHFRKLFPGLQEESRNWVYGRKKGQESNERQRSLAPPPSHLSRQTRKYWKTYHSEAESVSSSEESFTSAKEYPSECSWSPFRYQTPRHFTSPKLSRFTSLSQPSVVTGPGTPLFDLINRLEAVQSGAEEAIPSEHHQLHSAGEVDDPGWTSTDTEGTSSFPRKSR
ncbi:hypothetical protein BJ508DRAFT_335559 [Ascobolus immersus RN42]|uniref:Uncharacterized protein n=1 Tax=Ascobolus immersus RN42 TaxID=1160509 RepID=A0A3N4HI36_ASCIM|nr:hypothetical protein BJ508DRAFT_335559 [Ascobolus immersus RN42]